MNLCDHERGVLSGATGPEGVRMATEVVVEAARMMGADRLVPIVSSHIDGCSKRYVAAAGYGKARISSLRHASYPARAYKAKFLKI